MSLQIHQYYLRKYIDPNDFVLELGAGSGRFTIFLFQIGAKIITSDISKVQLDINRNNIANTGLDQQVIDFKVLDITNLTELDDETFDKVVVIGGPLSYVFDKKDQAMREILRVVKTGGLIVIGVMSRYGALQRVLRAYIPDLIRGKFSVEQVLDTGNDPGYLAFEGHHSHLFTYDELKEFLSEFPVEIIDATASNYLTAQRADELHDIVDHQEAWQRLFEMELNICKQIVDGGSHILVVVKK